MADAAPEPDGDGGAGTRSASPATPDEGTEMGMGGHTHTPPPGEEPFTPHGSPVLDASVVFQPREKGGGVPGTSSFAPPTTRKPPTHPPLTCPPTLPPIGPQSVSQMKRLNLFKVPVF